MFGVNGTCQSKVVPLPAATRKGTMNALSKCVKSACCGRVVENARSVHLEIVRCHRVWPVTRLSDKVAIWPNTARTQSPSSYSMLCVWWNIALNTHSQISRHHLRVRDIPVTGTGTVVPGGFQSKRKPYKETVSSSDPCQCRAKRAC